jgi:hypothetical protein
MPEGRTSLVIVDRWETEPRAFWHCKFASAIASIMEKRLCRPQQFIAFSFHFVNLAQHQLEPVDLAKNLRLEVSWHRASVSGPQFFQTFPAACRLQATEKPRGRR